MERQTVQSRKQQVTEADWSSHKGKGGTQTLERKCVDTNSQDGAAIDSSSIKPLEAPPILQLSLMIPVPFSLGNIPHLCLCLLDLIKSHLQQMFLPPTSRRKTKVTKQEPLQYPQYCSHLLHLSKARSSYFFRVLKNYFLLLVLSIMAPLNSCVHVFHIIKKTLDQCSLQMLKSVLEMNPEHQLARQ